MGRMWSVGRCAKVASAALVVNALALLPGTGWSATAAGNPGTTASVVASSSAATLERHKSSALPAPRAAASEPKPYAMLTAEPKPYAMLLAGLGLIVFVARRRSRALNAEG